MEEKADPQLKASMLEAVDNQIQGNDPPEVGVAFKRLVNPLSPPSAPVQNPLSPLSPPPLRSKGAFKALQSKENSYQR